MSSKLLLVDDDNSLRDAVSLYLREKGFHIDSARDVHSALTFLNMCVPDLIISDIIMPESNGYKFIELIKDNPRYNHVPFIFLTAKGMTQDRILGYELGCHAYLTKPFDPEELFSIIKNVLHNYVTSLNSPSMDHTLIKSFKDSSNFTIKKIDLTYREKTVLELVLQGMMNKEIAETLRISVRNVEKYVSRLLIKTSTRNRTELAQFYHSYNFSNKGE
jgi:DNA-binding NarL/FixJ family response regulator